MKPETPTENPLLPNRTIKLASQCFKIGSTTGLLPWHLQPEVKATPLVRRENGRYKWLLILNIEFGYLLFVPLAIYTLHGILNLGWARTQQMFSLLCIALLCLPVLVGFMLMRERDCFATLSEGWKHIGFLQQYLQPQVARTPKLVLQSQVAMEAVYFMVYSNSFSAALATLMVPWLPLSLSNVIEVASGYKISYPWKIGAKLMDFGVVFYGGVQCAEHILMPLLVLHCLGVCNTAVLREFMSEKPKLIHPAVVNRYDVVIEIWRRIEILNIGFNKCFAKPFLVLQTAYIVIGSAGVFAAIKTQGLTSVSFGSLAFFGVFSLFAVLTYVSLLGETMVEMKTQMERECRAHALFRRQVRSLRPAFLTAGSFYYVDKGCIVTCAMIIVDNVFDALMMAQQND